MASLKILFIQPTNHYFFLHRSYDDTRISQNFIYNSINGMLNIFAYYDRLVCVNTPYTTVLPYFISLHIFAPDLLEKADANDIIDMLAKDSFWPATIKSCKEEFAKLLEKVIVADNIRLVLDMILSLTQNLNLNAATCGVFKFAVITHYVKLLRSSVADGNYMVKLNIFKKFNIS